MIEQTHPKLLVGGHCRLLSISRSSFYRERRGETAMNLGLMLLIDKQFLGTPFHGVRQMSLHLQNESHAVNEKRIRPMRHKRRLRENSLSDRFLILLCAEPSEAWDQQASQGHKTCPYRLGGLLLERHDQV